LVLALAGSWEAQRYVCLDPISGSSERPFHETFRLSIDPLLIPSGAAPLSLRVIPEGGDRFTFDGVVYDPAAITLISPLVVSPPNEVTLVDVAWDAPFRVPSNARFKATLLDGGGVELEAIELRLRLVARPSDPACEPVPGPAVAVLFASVPASDPPGPGALDSEIWILDGDGARPLTDNDVEDVDPCWSGNRSRIAFLRLVPSPPPVYARWVLMIMDRDGSNAQMAADFEPQSALHPAWAPAGNRIAVAVGPPGLGHESLCVVDLDRASDDPERLLWLTDAAGDLHPTWSPDGGQIAFVRDFTAILRLNSDGSSLAPLMVHYDPLAAPSHPDWGGRGFVFSGYEEAGYRLRWLDNAGTLHPVTTGGSHIADMAPRWSEDGAHVLFVRDAIEGATSRLRRAVPELLNADVELDGQPAGDHADPDW
jgi:hypothetical protein